MNTLQFESFFNKMWEDAQSEVLFHSVDISRILDVHPSQIPICPASFILGFTPDENIQQSHKMIGDCILETGSTIHSVVQDFLGLSPYAFGDYACPECGELFPLSTGQECPNGCGIPLRYREVGINYKGFAGHVDFLIKKDDEIWLVDFKTSAHLGIAAKVKNTPVNYDLQTLAYALLLRLQYGLKVKGRAIAYISRDAPATMKLGGCKVFTKKDLKYIQGLLKEQRELLNFLLDCRSYEEYMDNVGIQPCTNPYCSVCSKYSDDDVKVLLKKKFETFEGQSVRDFVNRFQAEQRKHEKLLEDFIGMCKGDKSESKN